MHQQSDVKMESTLLAAQAVTVAVMATPLYKSADKACAIICPDRLRPCLQWWAWAQEAPRRSAVRARNLS
jgi:hypothetical protein